MNEPQYDKSALRFIDLIARRLVELAQPKLGDTVLDVGAKDGVVALHTVRKVGPTGQVISVKGCVHNALCEDPWIQLQFADATFDLVLCPATIFFLPDMVASLREWRRVLKPGGTVAFFGYGKQTFQPLASLLETCIRRYGVSLPIPLFPWQHLTDLEQYSDLLRNAGFSTIDVRSEQFGYYLVNSDEWWEVLWRSGLRESLAVLASAAIIAFKAEHLAAVADLATARRVWLNITVIFAVGQKG